MVVDLTQLTEYGVGGTSAVLFVRSLIKRIRVKNFEVEVNGYEIAVRKQEEAPRSRKPKRSTAK